MMEIERFLSWPPDSLAGENTSMGTGAWRENEEQPGFAIEVLWNRPRRLWEPCLIVKCWRWKAQVGWLYG